MSESTTTRTDSGATPEIAPAAPRGGWTAIGVAVVLGLGALTLTLAARVPDWSEGTWFESVAGTIEFPVYAIALGFLGNGVLSLLGVRDRMSAAFRTELFIKIGLVLLGATVNINVILQAALPGIIQAALLITVVFLFTWWFAGLLGVEPHLRALLASALSICGVSAAVAAAGAVHAKKEQLAYTAGLVIVFALPSIFLLPWLAGLLGLSPAVAGAWIGGNIDTTAAVTAAGAVAGEQVLEYASIVKMTQNALIGVVAVALSVYFTMRVDRPVPAVAGVPATTPRRTGPGWSAIWQRFPKFVLGFIAASLLVTILTAVWPSGTETGAAIASGVGAAKSLQQLFFALAFVSIGLEFRFATLKEAGWRPVLVFLVATIVNLVVGLLLSWTLFGWIFGSWFPA